MDCSCIAAAGRLVDDEEEVYDSFDAMNLRGDLLEGISAYGYTKPSKVQQKGIVALCKGGDLILQAKAEPATTATYCLAILQQIDLKVLKCQCIIVAPSLVPVDEIAAEMEALARFLQVKICVCGKQNDRLTTGVHVAVGTRDRVLRLLKEGRLGSDEVKMLVLDGADLLLRLDYMMDEVYQIFECLRKQTRNKLQVGVFSETMPPKMVDWLKLSLMKNPNPLILLADGEELTLEGIKKHRFINVEDAKSKPRALCHLLSNNNVGATAPVIIIVENPQLLASLTSQMKEIGFKVSATRRGMDQRARDEIALDFLVSGLLITTSRWARGITFLQPVQLVVIYDMCLGGEYFRLMGWFRGVDTAISFATHADWEWLIDIQEMCNVVFERFQFETTPSKPEVQGRELKHMKHVLYNSRNESGKFSTLTDCLPEVIAAAGMCIIFVNQPNKIDLLVDFMNHNSSGCKVVNTYAAFMELVHNRDTITSPIVLITTSLDVRLARVPLVLMYDLNLDFEAYNRCIDWCANTGVVINLAAKEDWCMAFQIQSWYSVSLTWLPNDILAYFRPAHRISNRQRRQLEPPS